MPRNKVPPRKVISKRVAKGHQTSIEKSYTDITVLSHYPPTEIFTSEHSVRGEVLHISRELLHSRDAHKRRHTHVLFLPGNPGVIEYYRPIIRCIFDRLPHDVTKSVSIHGLGLPGHDVRELNGTRQFKIADHVAHVKKYLGSGHVQPSLTNSNLIIIGHSYGSYLGVRVLEELGEAVIHNSGMVLLMPALWEMGECAGAMTRFMVSDRFGSISWGLWAATAIIPPVLRDVIVRALGHDGSVESVTRSLVDGRRRGLYMNIGRLARDEIICIRDPTRHAWCADIGERSLLVWADADKWCPDEGKAVIGKAFGDRLRVEYAGEGVRHEFVTSRAETDKVARILAAWVTERVRSDDEAAK